MNRRVSSLCCCLLCCLGPLAGTARAANVEPILVGGQATLTGGAAIATVEDTGAAWYNPAGLAGIEGTSLRVGADTFMLRAYRAGTLVGTKLPDRRLVVPLSHTEFLALPTALVLARQLSPRWAVAFGLFTRAQDFLSSGDDLWARDQTRVDGDAGGGTRYRYNQRITMVQRISNYYGAASVGWQVTPTLRLGAALFGVFESVRASWKFATDYELLGGSQLRIQSREDRDWSQLSVGLQLLLGVQWAPTARWRLGFAVRSASLMLGRWINGGGSWAYARVAQGEASVIDGGHGSFEGVEPETVGVVQPPHFYFGVARLFAWGSMALDGELAPPLEDSDFDAYYRLNWNVRLGARVDVSRTLSLGGGLFTARTPHRLADSFPDATIDFYGGALGVELRTIFARASGKRPLVLATSLGLRYSLGKGSLISREADTFGDKDALYRDVPVDATFHELAVHLSSGIRF